MKIIFYWLKMLNEIFTFFYSSYSWYNSYVIIWWNSFLNRWGLNKFTAKFPQSFTTPGNVEKYLQRETILVPSMTTETSGCVYFSRRDPQWDFHAPSGKAARVDRKCWEISKWCGSETSEPFTARNVTNICSSHYTRTHTHTEKCDAFEGESPNVNLL